MTAGRPTEYKEEYCEEFVIRRANGETHVMIAAAWDTTPQTLWNWSKKHPKFFDAFTRGHVKFQACYEKMCVANFYNNKFNTNLFALWMKNKAGWFENAKDQKVELGDLGKNPIKKLISLLKDGQLSSSVFKELVETFCKINEIEKGDQFLEAMEALKEVKKGE